MTEHQRIVAAIESSRVFSIADRIVLWVSKIAAESRAGELIKLIGDWASALPADVLQFGLGVLLIAAAATHALAMVLIGLPESWLWPLLPFAAAVIGGVLLLFGVSRRSGRPAE